MTALAPPPAAAEPEPAPVAPPAPGPRQRARALWRRGRWYLAAAGVLLLVGTLVAGIPGSSDDYSALDPRSGSPSGTRAADQLLRQRGVDSRTAADTGTLAAALRAPDTTVVLTYPDELGHQDLNRLSAVPRGDRTRLVLIAPDQAALNAFAPDVEAGYTDTVPGQSVDPSCRLPEAVNAGNARLGGQSYLSRDSGDTACYPVGARSFLISHTRGSQQVIVLGTAAPLTNQRLDEGNGNAALALGLLGAHDNLVWQVPGHPVTVHSDDPKTLGDFVPDGWYWATLQLALAALLAVVWRTRRLGPVLSERLPAVVRASETTEGRARLYHRANARGHAAETLRRAARRRTAAALGLPHTSGDPDPAALTEAAAARLGRPAADLQHLLYGPAPTDDAALLRLADDLDDMEWQVRQP